MDMRELHAFRVQFSHVSVFSDSLNVTKSDTSGHCLACPTIGKLPRNFLGILMTECALLGEKDSNGLPLGI